MPSDVEYLQRHTDRLSQAHLDCSKVVPAGGQSSRAEADTDSCTRQMRSDKSKYPGAVRNLSLEYKIRLLPGFDFHSLHMRVQQAERSACLTASRAVRSRGTNHDCNAIHAQELDCQFTHQRHVGSRGSQRYFGGAVATATLPN